MQLGTIDLNKLRGLTDKSVGLGKEFVGALVGNEKLQREGQAQQDKAAAELDALREELKAAKHDAEAKTAEGRERMAQEAKGKDSDNGKLGRSTGSGITETVKGKAKEVVADITDNAQLKREAEAQQNKGEAETQATKARAKAKAHEAEAKEKELEQRLNQ